MNCIGRLITFAFDVANFVLELVPAQAVRAAADRDYDKAVRQVEYDDDPFVSDSYLRYNEVD